MWSQFTSAAVVALRTSHTPRSKVEVWHSGKPVYALDTVTSGVVRADVDSPVRRDLSCSLFDATGALSKGDVDDLLNPYDCEIAVFRGVAVPGSTTLQYSYIPTAGFGLQTFGTSGFGGSDLTVTGSTTSYATEYAPHGVFQLTGRDVQDTPDGLVISLVGQDRTMQYQGPMESALAISAGTPVETAVQILLSTRNPGLTLRAMKTGFTCGPLIYPPDSDVWREASDLAVSVGGSLFHDRTGQCVLAMTGPASDLPVGGFAEGDGLLQRISRKEDSDTIRNVVIVESTSGLVRAVAEDTNPASPTYARGRYGRRPVTIVNQHIGSPLQAQQAALSRLSYELGRSETVTFDAVPNPAQDVSEVVTVNRPRIGLNYRALTIATLDMPLGVQDVMRVGCRRSVLAPDGAVVTAVTL